MKYRVDEALRGRRIHNGDRIDDEENEKGKRFKGRIEDKEGVAIYHTKGRRPSLTRFLDLHEDVKLIESGLILPEIRDGLPFLQRLNAFILFD